MTISPVPECYCEMCSELRVITWQPGDPIYPQSGNRIFTIKDDDGSFDHNECFLCGTSKSPSTCPDAASWPRQQSFE